MKPFLAALLLVVSSAGIFAATAVPPLSPKATTPPSTKSDATAELASLVARINEKLKAGVPDQAALANDLKGFDAILAAHKGEKTDAVAEVLFTKAMLHVQVLRDAETGAQLLAQLKAEFPNAKQSKQVDAMLAELAPHREMQKAQALLKPGLAFPDFNVTDLAGSPLSVAKFKGKVVLVDFWATWCGPCIQELPNVLAAYEKYRPKGFEIIGVSLDDKEATFKSFIKNSKIPWPQYFDGKGWQNQLVGKYGITGIPATFLIDKTGKIVARDLRGPQLDAALAQLLGK